MPVLSRWRLADPSGSNWLRLDCLSTANDRFKAARDAMMIEHVFSLLARVRAS